MPDRTDRGTTEDPAWPRGNLTGGNDSGTARVNRSKLDQPQGADRTAKILNEEGGSVAGFPGPDPSVERPLEQPAGRAAHGETEDPGVRSDGPGTVTDESGRIASSDLGAGQGNNPGAARDPRVSGRQE